MKGSVTRRGFFASVLTVLASAPRLNGAPAPSSHSARVEAATALRTRAAIRHSNRSVDAMVANGDEDALAKHAGAYAKGIARNQFGEVDDTAYGNMLAAIRSGQFRDFERLRRGAGRNQSNPQAAYAFHLEGGDPHTFGVPPAPSVKSAMGAREASELYWQALCRDIPFHEYAISPVVREAATHLATSPQEIFRGPTRGDLHGPYLSQFLWKPIRYGGLRLDQRYSPPLPGSDFMTAVGEWSQIQAGVPSWRMAAYEPALRYIRNGRDLAEYVHYDFSYQAFLNAALILINSGPHTILNCNQFKSSNNPYRYSTIEDGFVTFGPAEVTDWLGRVTTAALKAAWCHKWLVHRRLRPEELGGLVHRTRTSATRHPIHDDLLKSPAVNAVFERTGSYLLPQAYPEGSPMHPSYPSGHAVIAGACSVVLKACFDGTMLLPGCVEASADGLSLVPLDKYSPTIGEEIDKLAFNISMGRNWAGIHYRSDATAGLRLGEDVAITILQDLACTYTEDYEGFEFKRFDGSLVKITPRGEVLES